MNAQEALIQVQRKQLAKKLPALALRVFALEGKSYPGYGNPFHTHLIVKVGYGLLVEHVVKAEKALESA